MPGAARMNRCRSALVCAAALFMLASSWARASDPDWNAADEQIEPPLEPACACDAPPSPSGIPLGVFIPNLTPGFQFSAGFLLLKPGADNLGWSTITTFLPLENPQWAVQSLNPLYQPGISVGARYVIPCCGKDIQTNWEHLRTNDSAAVAVSDPTTQWISPFNQTGPSTSEQANQVGIFHLKSAQAQVAFDYDMVNLDAGQTVNVGPNTQLRLFAGLSFVRLREQLVSTFYNDPNIDPVLPVVAPPNTSLRSISLNNTSTFTGVGPRLGLTTAHNLSHGFNFVGQLSGAVLAGWMQPAQYSFAAVFEDAVNSEQISSHRVTQVVFASDAKLGLGYSRLLGNGSVLSIESGFKAAIFINPFSTYETSTNVLPLDIGSLSTNSMRHTPSNFTLNGFYATGSLRW
ncbi:MAG TPA: Lpg1974 family pore-forming outer membrane protein [Pirellulales bacterium]|nr:Lpg1974 family pore-forming outer membrane protein [Pirellulales bacterium]